MNFMQNFIASKLAINKLLEQMTAQTHSFHNKFKQLNEFFFFYSDFSCLAFLWRVREWTSPCRARFPLNNAKRLRDS